MWQLPPAPLSQQQLRDPPTPPPAHRDSIVWRRLTDYGVVVGAEGVVVVTHADLVLCHCLAGDKLVQVWDRGSSTSRHGRRQHP